MKRNQIIFLVIAIIVAITIIKTIKNKNEFLNNRTSIKAVVKEYSHVKYIDNAESQRTIEFHRIVYRYGYNGQYHTGIIELQPSEFRDTFLENPSKSDTIDILISTKKPEISKINIAQ